MITRNARIMIPVSLYIHMPWCIKKCPYCDFNSHKKPNELNELIYIQALIKDLTQDLTQDLTRNLNNNLDQNRPLTSIFIGGGTPSLFSPESYQVLFNSIRNLIIFDNNIEITMEANPGAIEHGRFHEYRAIGINRLSLGVQSFNPKHLQSLGRIHSSTDAKNAFETARAAGFERINLDIMHGLPNQSVEEALEDLNTAIYFKPEHISWYQLTIEPNTLFYKKTPQLPTEDILESIEQNGFSQLNSAGFSRYEISAFCKPNQEARHNLNYWLYGDYYGIGAGAHGKITYEFENFQIYRTQKQRQPDSYLNAVNNQTHPTKQVTPNEAVFEFMLNASRLEALIPYALFTQRTGLPLSALTPGLTKAHNLGLINLNNLGWQVTELGRRFTHNIQEIFV